MLVESSSRRRRSARCPRLCRFLTRRVFGRLTVRANCQKMPESRSHHSSALLRKKKRKLLLAKSSAIKQRQHHPQSPRSSSSNSRRKNGFALTTIRFPTSPHHQGVVSNDDTHDDDSIVSDLTMDHEELQYYQQFQPPKTLLAGVLDYSSSDDSEEDTFTIIPTQSESEDDEVDDEVPPPLLKQEAIAGTHSSSTIAVPELAPASTVGTDVSPEPYSVVTPTTIKTIAIGNFSNTNLITYLGEQIAHLAYYVLSVVMVLLSTTIKAPIGLASDLLRSFVLGVVALIGMLGLSQRATLI